MGWTLVVLVFAAFVWGLDRRSRLEMTGDEVIRMLFVPSVEQGTLVTRGDDLARWVREDAGLTLRSEVPTSYAAVIQALGSDQADVAWMPAFAYVLANARYGAEARLQVVRSADRSAIVVTRRGDAGLAAIADLAGRSVAFPKSFRRNLRQRIVEVLDREAPGWIEVGAESDRDAVRQLLDRPLDVDAAVSSWVFSGPYDFVGDGRKELEYERPGTLEATRILFKTAEPVSEASTVYYGCVYARTDSSVRRLEQFNGRRFAFSDETSTSGHIFPRLLLDRRGVTLGRVYYAGGHPNVIQAVWDGKADGGAAFYSPPSEKQIREGMLVGDARYLLLKRMPDVESRRAFLDEVRVLALTDPIPNDLCAVRRGFPPAIWRRFADSLQRYLATEEGQQAFFDLLAGVAVSPTDDRAFDGFRLALDAAGLSAEKLLEAEEKKLESRGGGG
ncbi:MAG: PhnD/SsuA/transferrin family substrate-binding protein [Thermoanaerobaculia bacterium]|nr:PhnD/SsuA/transferrin family substrate-binding protein [Thermoanaerobaculia bacterium]